LQNGLSRGFLGLAGGLVFNPPQKQLKKGEKFRVEQEHWCRGGFRAVGARSHSGRSSRR
jgi:hypothetical protein